MVLLNILILVFVTSFIIFISFLNSSYSQLLDNEESGLITLEKQLELAREKVQQENNERFYNSKLSPLSSYKETVSQTSNSTKIYENRDLGFKIEYPANEGWNLIYFNNDRNSTENDITIYGEDNIHLRKAIGANNETNSIIEIMFRNNTFWSQSGATAKDVALTIMLIHFGLGGKIIDHGNLGGKFGNNGYYIDIIDGFNQRLLGYYIPDGDKIVYIEYSSDDSLAFEVYLPYAVGIIESFQLLD